MGMDISFVLADLYDVLRPSMKRFQTIEEVEKEIETLKDQGRSFEVSQRAIADVKLVSEHFQ
jgi:hypothetical protein